MKYGYRMCDCTVDELNIYKEDCYQHKKTFTPMEKFGAVKFTSVEQAKSLIRHILIPEKHAKLVDASWTLVKDNTMLVKEIAFKTKHDAELYQEAVERAWALGGHLDPRTEQSYHA